MTWDPLGRGVAVSRAQLLYFFPDAISNGRSLTTRSVFQHLKSSLEVSADSDSTPLLLEPGTRLPRAKFRALSIAISSTRVLDVMLPDRLSVRVALKD